MELILRDNWPMWGGAALFFALSTLLQFLRRSPASHLAVIGILTLIFFLMFLIGVLLWL